MNFEDFSKFKTLLEHAEFHQVTYGDSFVSFLVEHYGDTTFHNSDEHKEHEDLPFKDSQHISSHISTVFTLNSIKYTLGYSVSEAVYSNFLYKESISLFEKQKIFQPPKFA